MREQIKSLAKEIEREWRGGSIAAFTGAAVQALGKADLVGAIDLAALTAWTLSTDEFPEECNPFGDAGPPAFTVFRGERFVLNLYLYLTPDLFIHDHGFAGAFVNLAGDSLHCSFELQIEGEPGPGVLTGKLELRKTELLRPGMVAPLMPGSASAHRVWHLGRPTIVLVARTLEAPRGVIQYQYDAPGLATRIVRPPPYGPEIPWEYKKRSKMFEFLREAGHASANAYLQEMILAADAWAAVTHLLDHWNYLEESSLLPRVLEKMRGKFGAWVEGIPAVSRGIVLHRSVDWDALREEGPRLLLALLLTYSEKRPIEEWIARSSPGTDVHDHIVTVLQEAWEMEALDTSLDQAGVAILRVMLRGLEGNQLLCELRKEFEIPLGGERTILETASQIGEIELLKPLFR